MSRTVLALRGGHDECRAGVDWVKSVDQLRHSATQDRLEASDVTAPHGLQ